MKLGVEILKFCPVYWIGVSRFTCKEALVFRSFWFRLIVSAFVLQYIEVISSVVHLCSDLGGNM